LVDEFRHVPLAGLFVQRGVRIDPGVFAVSPCRTRSSGTSNSEAQAELEVLPS
jgi:hypothetical protein